MVSITFPADGIILKFLDEQEGYLGCLRCIEALFDLGW
jgi:hypothetical protein